MCVHWAFSLTPFPLENCTSSPQGIATEGATKTIAIGASGEEGDLRMASGGDVLHDRPVDALRLVLATNRQRSGNRLRERKVVVGGLGHIAVQILKALTPARILAVDEAYARLREESLNGRRGVSTWLIADDGNERR
jgi:hypothetical protein